MLYDEKEVVEICKKYGIEVVEKEGYPLYQSKEMDENFSIAEIMNESIKIKYSIWDEISDYMEYLKRKLKLKGEMCVIGIKILFLRLKYLVCNVEMKVIEWKEKTSLKVRNIKDRLFILLNNLFL